MLAALALAALGSLSTSETSSVATEDRDADPLRHAMWAAILDGGWSIALTVSWAISARSLDAPKPDGLAGLAFARVLYGTTWSVLIASEIALLRAIAGERWEGLSSAWFKNDWLIGLDIPADCRLARSAACGKGLGAYSELSVRIVERPLPIEIALTGGWVQGHFDTDERRTLIESTWVMAPLVARAHLPIDLGFSRLDAALGGGLYFGLHNAHVHPKRGAAIAADVPIWELFVLDGGLGPGVHARVRLELFRSVALEAGLDLAPFVLGGSRDPPAASPVGEDRGGSLVWWRRASAGAALTERWLWPVRVGARAFALELGPGPLARARHRGVLLHFEVPFDLPEDSAP